MVKSQVVKTFKVDLRKIVIGLLFGSFLLIIPGILDFLSFEVFKPSGNNLPFLQIINNVISINLINSFLGGFLGLVLFGFKSKLKSFLIGFILTLITHSVIPFMGPFVVYPILPKDFNEAGGFVLLLLYGPLIIGATLANFFLPKEDFMPQKKNIVIIAVIFLSLYFFVDNYHRIRTKVEIMPNIPETQVNEPREAFLNEEKDSQK